MTIVTFDEFKRLDLRIGKITQVDPHPDADKLYVMKIDMVPPLSPGATLMHCFRPATGGVGCHHGVGGGDIKQSVAGLKPYFTPEQLLNKTVVVLANLQPARLRGVESQVMLLAATSGDKVVLLVPEEDIPIGSKIS